MSTLSSDDITICEKLTEWSCEQSWIARRETTSAAAPEGSIDTIPRESIRAISGRVGALRVGVGKKVRQDISMLRLLMLYTVQNHIIQSGENQQAELRLCVSWDLCYPRRSGIRRSERANTKKVHVSGGGRARPSIAHMH